MNVKQDNFRDVVNNEVERQVVHRLNGLIATTVEETCTDAIRVAGDFIASQMKSNSSGLIYFSILQMIESRQLGCDLETR